MNRFKIMLGLLLKFNPLCFFLRKERKLDESDNVVIMNRVIDEAEVSGGEQETNREKEMISNLTFTYLILINHINLNRVNLSRPLIYI